MNDEGGRMNGERGPHRYNNVFVVGSRSLGAAFLQVGYVSGLIRIVSGLFFLWNYQGCASYEKPMYEQKNRTDRGTLCRNVGLWPG